MDRYLKEARPKEKLRILRLDCEGALCRRLMDLGMVEGTIVECVGIAPLGDPCAFLIRGAVIALRRADMEGILVEEAK